MLRAERDERTITIISDDANAENAALGDAIESAAPELVAGFNGTPVVDGELRFQVDQADWLSLMEALETLGMSGDVDPEEAEAAYDLVETACREESLL